MKSSSTQRKYGKKHGRNSKTRRMIGGNYDKLLGKIKEKEKEIEDYTEKNPHYKHDINDLLNEKYDYVNMIYNADGQDHKYGHLEPIIIRLVNELKENENEFRKYMNKVKSAPQRQKYGRYGSRSSDSFESSGDKTPNKRQKISSSRSQSRSNSRSQSRSSSR